MRFVWIILIIVGVSQAKVTITKNSGETMQLSQVTFYQGGQGSKTSLNYMVRDEKHTIELSSLKRINLKESLERKGGVTTWLAILVDKSNDKQEVELKLKEIRGLDENGKEEVVSANTINKITL